MSFLSTSCTLTRSSSSSCACTALFSSSHIATSVCRSCCCNRPGFCWSTASIHQNASVPPHSNHFRTGCALLVLSDAQLHTYYALQQAYCCCQRFLYPLPVKVANCEFIIISEYHSLSSCTYIICLLCIPLIKVVLDGKEQKHFIWHCEKIANVCRTLFFFPPMITGIKW